MYMHVYEYVCAYVCLYVYVYVHMCVCMSVHIIYMYKQHIIYMYVCHICIHMLHTILWQMPIVWPFLAAGMPSHVHLDQCNPKGENSRLQLFRK